MLRQHFGDLHAQLQPLPFPALHVPVSWRQTAYAFLTRMVPLFTFGPWLLPSCLSEVSQSEQTKTNSKQSRSALSSLFLLQDSDHVARGTYPLRLAPLSWVLLQGLL